eukprot:5339124-Karenia_brevis.AAC.1
MEGQTDIMPIARNPSVIFDSSRDFQIRSTHDDPPKGALYIQMSIFGCDRLPTPSPVYRTPDD